MIRLSAAVLYYCAWCEYRIHHSPIIIILLLLLNSPSPKILYKLKKDKKR